MVQRVVVGAGCQRLCGCGRGARPRAGQPGAGRARMVARRRANWSAQGQRAGARKVRMPERFTMRAGTARMRVLTVRATVSVSTGSPMVAVQRMRLWASTVHWSQAELAEKLPEGQCQPGAFFEVGYGQLDAGVLTVERVDLDGGAVQVGEKPEVPPVRPQPGLSLVGEPGAGRACG